MTELERGLDHRNIRVWVAWFHPIVLHGSDKVIFELHYKLLSVTLSMAVNLPQYGAKNNVSVAIPFLKVGMFQASSYTE